MKNLIGMAVILIAGLGPAWADTAAYNTAATPVPTTSPTPAAEMNAAIPQQPLPGPKAAATITAPSGEFHLTGKFGFGSGMVPFNPNLYYGQNLSTISARYWVSEQFCLDLEGCYNGYSDSGTNFIDNPIQTPNETYSVGLGFKYNLKEPVKYLFLQLLGQASYADNTYQNAQVTQLTSTNNETWGGFVGLGFEYFVPFFDSISLESNIGYSFNFNNVTTTTQYSPNLYPVGYSTSSTVGTRGSLIEVNGMTLSSLIVHFYF